MVSICYLDLAGLFLNECLFVRFLNGVGSIILLYYYYFSWGSATASRYVTGVGGATCYALG